VTLWRPTGLEERTLVEASGWREWPPRLPGQPILSPVLNEYCATMIARLERPAVRRRLRDPLPGLPVVSGPLRSPPVGGQTILEYWIPAEDLSALNSDIVRKVELTAEFH
jgi:hypothetical protein